MLPKDHTDDERRDHKRDGRPQVRARHISAEEDQAGADRQPDQGFDDKDGYDLLGRPIPCRTPMEREHQPNRARGRNRRRGPRVPARVDRVASGTRSSTPAQAAARVNASSVLVQLAKVARISATVPRHLGHRKWDHLVGGALPSEAPGPVGGLVAHRRPGLDQARLPPAQC